MLDWCWVAGESLAGSCTVAVSSAGLEGCLSPAVCHRARVTNQGGRTGQDTAQASLNRGMGMLTSADPTNTPSMQESVLENESEAVSFAVGSDVVKA